MTSYLLESFLCLAAMLLAYRLFLSQTTLHRLKRFFLLACLLVPLTLPMAQWSVYYGEAEVIWLNVNTETAISNERNTYIDDAELPDALADDASATTQAATRKGDGLTFWLWCIYGGVVSVLLIRLVVNLIRMWQQAKLGQSRTWDQFRLILLPGQSTPYSFFRLVFIAAEDFDNKATRDGLLSHEFAHASQLHSIDILLLELAKVFFWFNPLYYLLGKSIKLNHEYLADAHVLKEYRDPLSYQKLLLSFAGRSLETLPLASPSSFSFIKHRFIMMQKNTSRKTALVRISLLAMVIVGISLSIAMDLRHRPPVYLQAAQDEQKADPGTASPLGFPVDSVYYRVQFTNLQPKYKLRLTDDFPGIDISARKGRTVIASADGVVQEASLDHKDYGQYILIKHSEDLSTLYASLSDVKVSVGQQVKRGQLLGSIGTTMATRAIPGSVHRVHYAVRSSNQWVDPYQYFSLPTAPSTDNGKEGWAMVPLSYPRAVELVSDPKAFPNILPFETANSNFFAYTGMTGGSATIHSLYDSSMGTEFFSLPNIDVRATADGTVTKAVANDERYGNYVVVKHDETHETMYAKLAKLLVNQGQKVKRGAPIGKTGSEDDLYGRFHYKVLRERQTMSPHTYFQESAPSGPRTRLRPKKEDGLTWNFVGNFAYKSIRLDQQQATFIKSNGTTITKRARDLSTAQKSALLTLRLPPPPPPAKRPVPEEVYSRWEKPWAYKILLDGVHIESKEMVNYQPEDFAHCSWVVVSKAVKARNGYAFELSLWTEDYYQEYVAKASNKHEQWQKDVKRAMRLFEDL